MLVDLHGTDVEFYHESACLNCIVLTEPTDVVIVGLSQALAEMFFSF